MIKQENQIIIERRGKDWIGDLDVIKEENQKRKRRENGDVDLFDSRKGKKKIKRKLDGGVRDRKRQCFERNQLQRQKGVSRNRVQSLWEAPNCG